MEFGDFCEFRGCIPRQCLLASSSSARREEGILSVKLNNKLLENNVEVLVHSSSSTTTTTTSDNDDVVASLLSASSGASRFDARNLLPIYMYAVMADGPLADSSVHELTTRIRRITCNYPIMFVKVDEHSKTANATYNNNHNSLVLLRAQLESLGFLRAAPATTKAATSAASAAAAASGVEQLPSSELSCSCCSPNVYARAMTQTDTASSSSSSSCSSSSSSTASPSSSFIATNKNEVEDARRRLSQANHHQVDQDDQGEDNKRYMLNSRSIFSSIHSETTTSGSADMKAKNSGSNVTIVATNTLSSPSSRIRSASNNNNNNNNINKNDKNYCNLNDDDAAPLPVVDRSVVFIGRDQPWSHMTCRLVATRLCDRWHMFRANDLVAFTRAYLKVNIYHYVK